MKIERKTQPPHAILQSPRESDAHHLRMFLGDIRTYVIPLRSNASNDGRFQTVPSDEKVVKDVLTLFSDRWRSAPNYRNLNPRYLSDALSAFVSAVAHDLALKGVSYWEIGKVHDEELSLGSSPRLFWITGEVSERRNQVRQRYQQREDGKFTRGKVILPADSVHVFRLPEALGTVREHHRRIQILQDVRITLPAFVEQAQSGQEQGAGFRYTEYSEVQFRALAKAMKEWGWMGRFWQNKYSTEYYWYFRQAKFHKSLAILRESILDDMNAVLKRLEIGCEITMPDIATVDQIDDVMAKLKDGSIAFGEAMDVVRS